MHGKNASPPATPQKLTVLTLATTAACIVWSVARGGVPDCLARWLRDAGLWRCDMHAEDLVTCFATEGVAAQGVVDLRELHSMVSPEATEVRRPKRPKQVSSAFFSAFLYRRIAGPCSSWT